MIECLMLQKVLSGLVYALLGIGDVEALLAHPIAGASWEGFFIENLAASAPEGTELFFYRTAGGAEIDLLLILPNRERWAVEIKRSLAPRPDRGFYSACGDVRPARRSLSIPERSASP
jgi:predicted AAA+ superfamily ATPase